MDPFFFLRARETGPLTVETVVLTPEDVFALLGGFDLSCFAANQENVSLSLFRRKGIGPWRDLLVDRLSPSGLVDASGTPCPELARALAPLASDGAHVSDGDLLSRRNQVERRTASICVDAAGERATGVVRVGRGFRLVPFGEDRSTWEASFLRMFHLESRFQPSWRPQTHFEREWCPEGSMIDTMFEGEEATRAYAHSEGVDPTGLVDLSAAMRSSLGGPNLLRLVAIRTTGCGFQQDCGFRFPMPISGPLRSRVSVVVPEKGFSYFYGCAQRAGSPDDWFLRREFADVSHYEGFCFLGSGESLMDSALTFSDCPEGAETASITSPIASIEPQRGTAS